MLVYRTEGENGGSERRGHAEIADTMPLKHKGDFWRWRRKRGKMKRTRETPLFVCRIVGPLSDSLSSYLGVLPLTTIPRPLAFWISMSPGPPVSCFLSFVCPEHTLKWSLPSLPPYLPPSMSIHILYSSTSPLSKVYYSPCLLFLTPSTRADPW